MRGLSKDEIIEKLKSDELLVGKVLSSHPRLTPIFNKLGFKIPEVVVPDPELKQPWVSDPEWL